jgi:septum formation protein
VKGQPLYLASASPRRAALLDQIGVTYRLYPVTVSEEPLPGEDAAALCRRLALAKARRAAAELGPEALVLGADTVVALDGALLGKPADRDEALAMVERLSGRTHEVFTAVALVGPGGEQVSVSVSRVTLRATSPAERAAYWATGEPADKAGAYAIQGRAAAFITRLEGSYSGVMGLPLCEVAEMLRSAGWPVLDAS